MLVWLDGRLNTRQRPVETSAARSWIFTFGIGQYNEFDVYAASRVFTGWNLRLVNRGNDVLLCASSSSTRTSTTLGKTFSFPIYRNGNRTIPAPLLTARGCIHLHHRARNASRYGTTAGAEDVGFLRQRSGGTRRGTLHDAASAYLQSGTRIESIVHYMLRSHVRSRTGELAFAF